MNKYEKQKAEYFATATIPDGYFGSTDSVSLSLMDGIILCVSQYGFFRSPLPDAVDVNEAIWLLENHPSSHGYFKNIKIKGQ